MESRVRVIIHMNGVLALVEKFNGGFFFSKNIGNLVETDISTIGTIFWFSERSLVITYFLVRRD